ncbi:MAG: hypothetical protein ACM31C_07445 [Acidobacteriota bacterium]
MDLAEQLARLRAQADRCRRTAIALDAKLRILEPARRDVHALREQLAASSARIDRAVDGLLARGHLPARLARPRR